MTLDTDEHPVDTEPAADNAWSWLQYAPYERVPWATAPIVWTAGEILHAAHLSFAVPAIMTVCAASWAYARFSRKAARSAHRELDGPEMAAAIAAPGAWLTLASKVGPLPFIGSPAHDLTSASFALTYIFGPVWLRRHEAVRGSRRRKIEAAREAARLAAEEMAWENKRAEWHILAHKVGLDGSDLLDAIDNQNDSETWEIDLYGCGKLASEVPPGRTAHIITGQKTTVLGGWKAPMDRVRVEAHPVYAYHLMITFQRGEPWKGGGEGGLIWHPLASGELDLSRAGAEFFTNPAPSIRDAICLGLNPETGEPMLLVLMDEKGAHRVLVLGTSGAGKSTILNTITERITACVDAELLQINLAKATEDKWWEAIAAASALTDANRDRALKILDFVHDICINGRPREMGYDNHEPTPGEPALVLKIDEVDTTADDEDRKHQLGIIASKCRSEGVILIIGSQRPQDVYVGGGMVRSNLTDIVWGTLRSNDLSQASGGLAALPDMNAYGKGVSGVFGVAQFPMREGAPVTWGRAFFWGKPAHGLISIIKARSEALGGRYPMPVLDRGLADRFGAQWADITGNATSAQLAEVTAKKADRGQVASEDAKNDVRQDRLASIFDQIEGASGGAPAAPPAAPTAAQVPAQPSQPAPAASAEVFPAADEAHLWQLLQDTEGGITTRRPENGGPLRRVNPEPGREFWNEEYVRRQLNIWRNQDKARLTGRGAEQRWVPVHLHAVPDPAPAPEPGPAPQTAVSDPPDAESDGFDLTGFSGHDLVMMAASWILRAPDLETGRDLALKSLPPHVVGQALGLIAHDPDYIRRELAKILTPARPRPPRPRENAETDEPDWGEDEGLTEDEPAGAAT